MNNNLNNSYLQGLLRPSSPLAAPRRASKPPIKQTRQPDEAKEYYFSLVVYKAAEDVQAEQQPIKILEANQPYKIVIQCDVNSSQPHQLPIKIRSGFKLSLKCSADTEIFPTILPLDQRTLLFAGPFAQPEVRHFRLPEECLSCNLTFTITYTEEDKVNSRPDVVLVTLPLHGTYTPENKNLLEAHYFATGLPETTLVLIAERFSDTKQCQVHGYNYRLPLLTAEILDTSDLVNVGDAIAWQEDADDIFSKLYDFWNSQAGGLILWLHTAYERFGSRFSVVIFDATDLEIPWELLEIDYDVYLGAVAQVSRWLPLDFFGHKKLLRIEDYTYQGSVISYLDKGLPSIIENEQRSLRLFEHESMQTLDKFKARVQRKGSLTQIAMVYLGCHGNKGILLHNTSQDEKLNALKMVKLHLQPDPRPLFFVNACESARILFREQAQPKNHTFLKNFLLHCASNYIGTIAEIDSGYASAIACYLLELAREANGVQITELLRQLRSGFLQEWEEFDQENASEKEYKEQRMKLLSSFLYVYYGNPLARLHLRTIELPTSEEQE